MENDFISRRDEFLLEYKKLIDKFECDFISYPQYVPNKTGTYDLRIVNDILDKKEKGVVSPFK